MRIAEVLFSQGFGSRRECAALLAAGLVQCQGRTLLDPHEHLPTEGLSFSVQGRLWPFQQPAMLMLHKPAGYECSRSPKHHPSVLSLLPTPLRRRGVQPVGRLDEDTTGLLLLTDSGSLIHRLTSPKWHVPKVYEVRTRHPINDVQVQQLLDGVMLHEDAVIARALACQRADSHSLQLTLGEGRYHQVKRMLAAVGNRVEALHRSQMGPLRLANDLPAGTWRWLSDDERTALLTQGKAGQEPDAGVIQDAGRRPDL